MTAVLSAEARTLLLSIVDDTDTDRLAAAVQEPDLDWNRLTWLAEREKATTRLWAVLTSLPPGIAPKAEVARLGRLAKVTEFRMLRLEQLLAGAIDTLDKQQIKVVLLKGAGLATTVYGSFVARPMYDVDLLVETARARDAWNALRTAGWMHDASECPVEFYESHYHLPPLDDPMRTGLALELHTGLSDGAIRLTGENILNSAREITVKGRRALVPTPEHQVIHLATHFAWAHGMASAAWRTFRDLECLLRHGGMDATRFLSEARATRAGTSCCWGAILS